MLNLKVLRVGLVLAILAVTGLSAFADKINPELANNLKDARAAGKQLLLSCSIAG